MNIVNPRKENRRSFSVVSIDVGLEERKCSFVVAGHIGHYFLKNLLPVIHIDYIIMSLTSTHEAIFIIGEFHRLVHFKSVKAGNAFQILRRFLRNSI